MMWLLAGIGLSVLLAVIGILFGMWFVSMRISFATRDRMHDLAERIANLECIVYDNGPGTDDDPERVVMLARAA